MRRPIFQRTCLIADCIRVLNEELTKEQKDQIRACKDRYDLIGLVHFQLGMSLRNRWGLWKGSRLKDYFEGLGLRHPDDMSGLIFRAYWRSLNDNPMTDEDIQAYIERCS